MNEQADPFLSGRMHCWLAPTAEVNGETYICVRGVNFRGEYRTGPRLNEAGDRSHQVERPEWLHVPSVTFPYDVNNLDETANAIVALEQVAQKIKAEWPALAEAKMQVVGQKFTSQWGGTTQAGASEAVTRFYLDLGKLDKLPDVVMKPDERVPFPRHPVFWVKASDIAMAADESCRFQNGADASLYKLAKSHTITMETDATGTTITRPTDGNLLQETVGDIYRAVRGDSFFAKARKPSCQPKG